ncbi:MAG: helix-turn-helix domain-containing protein [Breznakibacter sp.]
MKTNVTHEQYVKAQLRLEEIINLVDDNTPDNDPTLLELVDISNIIENYEKEHFQIGLPSLIEVIKLRMFEMKLKQKDLATLLGVPAARISEYLKEKREITLDIAKALHHKLNIDSDIILQ